MDHESGKIKREAKHPANQQQRHNKKTRGPNRRQARPGAGQRESATGRRHISASAGGARRGRRPRQEGGERKEEKASKGPRGHRERAENGPTSSVENKTDKIRRGEAKTRMGRMGHESSRRLKARVLAAKE